MHYIERINQCSDVGEMRTICLDEVLNCEGNDLRLCICIFNAIDYLYKKHGSQCTVTAKQAIKEVMDSHCHNWMQAVNHTS
jgi:hypothetical protein